MIARTARTVALASLAFIPSRLQAQTSTQASRFEAAVGARWNGTMDLGQSAANEVGSSGHPTPVFLTRSQLGHLTGIEGRVGTLLTRRVKVEAAVLYGFTELETHISSDTEGAAALTATERVKELVIAGEVVAYLIRLEDRRRTTPFLIGGVGYLRQLFSAQTLALTGQSYFAGGGIDVVLDRSTHTLAKAAGIRLDGRMILNSGGVALNHDRWFGPSAGASLFFRF